MKVKMMSVAVLGAGMFASAAADAACTTDPFQMGADAAEQACEDIAQGYVPPPPPPGGGVILPEHALPEPEWVCRWQDVATCKNAMAQYLRDPENYDCANYIREDIPLTTASGAPAGTANEVWRTYVNTTCNLP